MSEGTARVLWLLLQVWQKPLILSLPSTHPPPPYTHCSFVLLSHAFRLSHSHCCGLSPYCGLSSPFASPNHILLLLGMTSIIIQLKENMTKEKRQMYCFSFDQATSTVIVMRLILSFGRRLILHMV